MYERESKYAYDPLYFFVTKQYCFIVYKLGTNIFERKSKLMVYSN